MTDISLGHGLVITGGVVSVVSPRVENHRIYHTITIECNQGLVKMKDLVMMSLEIIPIILLRLLLAMTIWGGGEREERNEKVLGLRPR